MMKITQFAVLLATVAVATATDYCNSNLCGGSNHIACGHSNNWDSNCPGDAEMVNIDDFAKWVLVNRHNEKRDYIAGGNDPNHNTACRMGSIEWDDELAYLASLNVRQCDMRHDSCHNTDAFRYSGQNLAWQGYSGGLPDVQYLLENSVDMWFNEVSSSNRDIISGGYPQNYNGPAIGHFTVMVADKNVRLGCAASTYTRDGWKAFLLSCNYATTNIIGRQIYSSCSRAAEHCETGTNPWHPNLCSNSEWYDVNNI